MTTLPADELVERLRACANDPMWADHAEIPKRWCADAAALIEAQAAELSSLRANTLARRVEGLVAEYETAWGYDDDLRKSIGMQTAGQVIAAKLRAILTEEKL